MIILTSAVRDWLNRPVLEEIGKLTHELRKMEARIMAENVKAIDAAIEELKASITDLAGDFDAAVTKLEADIAAGTAGADLTPQVENLKALVAAIKGIDVKAEAIVAPPPETPAA